MKENLQTNQIRLEQIDPRGNLPLLTTLARVYGEVFAGPPWNEYTKCAVGCKEFFGLDTKPGDFCPKCNNTLELAYPLKDTISYIEEEMGKPNPVMFLGKDNNEIIGFTWGYSYLPKEFAEEKYRTGQMRETIVYVLKKEGIEERFFYCSETGIIESYRGRGLSNQFYKKRLEFAKKLELPVIARTNCNSPMVAVAESFNLRQIMGPKMIVDRLNKKIIPTGIMVNNCQDAEIEERVLFMLQ